MLSIAADYNRSGEVSAVRFGKMAPEGEVITIGKPEKIDKTNQIRLVRGGKLHHAQQWAVMTLEEEETWKKSSLAEKEKKSK